MAIQNVYVFKIANGQLQSYIELGWLQRPMFIPGTNRLLIHDVRDQLYEYDIQGNWLQINLYLMLHLYKMNSNYNRLYCLIDDILDDNLPWKILNGDENDSDTYNNSSDKRILDSSYAYINNNPIGVQLILEDNTYKLKVINDFDITSSILKFIQLWRLMLTGG